jgi:hypothetical protein
MPCEWLEKDGAVIHINRGRGRKRLTCRFCHRIYNIDDGKLCDFPVGNGKTCDAQMCSQCARTIGSQHTDMGGGFKKLNDTVDYCPIHAKQVPNAD